MAVVIVSLVVYTAHHLIRHPKEGQVKKLMLLVFAGLGLALAACSSSTPAPVSQDAQQLTVEATEFKFQPATIEVKSGQLVKLTLQNKGTVEHDWTVVKIAVTGKKESSSSGHDMGTSKPDLHVPTTAGKAATIEFTPTQPGSYQFNCTIAGHKEAGMVGTLVVK